MQKIRSLLFVPGHREGWIDKAIHSGADALALDLEDSVPHDSKVEARGIVARKAKDVSERTRVLVRINRGTYTYDLDDLDACIQPHIEGVILGKPDGPEDILVIDRVISELEDRRGLPVGGIRLVPVIETARAAELVFPIVSNARVGTVLAGPARNGDIARNLGMTWSEEGLEALHYRSRVVMACKAAGKNHPIGGLWQDVHDLEGFERFARRNRSLGFSGEIVLHPSSVAVANRVFSLSGEEIEYYQGLIAAFKTAEAAGNASTMYRGEHIDIAHAATARLLLAQEGK